jgi:hypothetical protein
MMALERYRSETMGVLVLLGGAYAATPVDALLRPPLLMSSGASPTCIFLLYLFLILTGHLAIPGPWPSTPSNPYTSR